MDVLAVLLFVSPGTPDLRTLADPDPAAVRKRAKADGSAMFVWICL